MSKQVGQIIDKSLSRSFKTEDKGIEWTTEFYFGHAVSGEQDFNFVTLYYKNGMIAHQDIVPTIVVQSARLEAKRFLKGIANFANAIASCC